MDDFDAEAGIGLGVFLQMDLTLIPSLAVLAHFTQTLSWNSRRGLRYAHRHESQPNQQ